MHNSGCGEPNVVALCTAVVSCYGCAVGDWLASFLLAENSKHWVQSACMLCQVPNKSCRRYTEVSVELSSVTTTYIQTREFILCMAFSAPFSTLWMHDTSVVAHGGYIVCFHCSTTHEFLFGALAELLDNARCVLSGLFSFESKIWSINFYIFSKLNSWKVYRHFQGLKMLENGFGP